MLQEHSENEASVSNDDDDDDDDEDSEEDDSEESYSENDELDKVEGQEERLENAENQQKITTEKQFINSNNVLRGRLNFDDHLPVVEEEEEIAIKKENENGKLNQQTIDIPSHNKLPFGETSTILPSDFDCPFNFPSIVGSSSPSKSSQEPGNACFSIEAHSKPPPPGWQNNVLTDNRSSNFTKNLTSSKDSLVAIDAITKPSLILEDGIAALSLDLPQTLAERRDAFFSKQNQNVESNREELFIETGDAKAFFDDEQQIKMDVNYPLTNRLIRSRSYQDLKAQDLVKESLIKNIDYRFSQKSKTKSESNLLKINSTSRQNFQKLSSSPPSPEVPEIPKLPTIDYKLFSNPFLKNFEQACQNFTGPLSNTGPGLLSSSSSHPLSIQVCESTVSTPRSIKVQPSFSLAGGSPGTSNCLACCKRKDATDRLRLIIPRKQEYHVTSFETPSPHTLRVPTSSTCNLIDTPNSPFHDLPNITPRQGETDSYDSRVKVAAQTQTTLEDHVAIVTTQPETIVSPEDPESENQPKKRSSRREKSGSLRDKKKRSPGSSTRRKDRQQQLQLKKQSSINSRGGDVPDSPSFRLEHLLDNNTKRESRSSSNSGQESPKKDQAKRVSLYFSAKKRPSISSTPRTSRSHSVDNARISVKEQQQRRMTRGDLMIGRGTNSDLERTNSIDSGREVMLNFGEGKSRRKGSTSSGSVPWCACWGNGCV